MFVSNITFQCSNTEFGTHTRESAQYCSTCRNMDALSE